MQQLEKCFLKILGSLSLVAQWCGFYVILRKILPKKIIILMYHGITKHHDPLTNFDFKHVEAQKFKEQLHYLKKQYSIISLDDFLRGTLHKNVRLPKNPVVLTFDDGYTNCYTQLFPLLKEEKIPATIFLPTQYISSGEIAWYDVVTYCIAKTKKPMISLNKKKFLLNNDRQKIAAITELKKEIALCNNYQGVVHTIMRETGVSPHNCHNENFTFLTWDQCREMSQHGIAFGAHSVTHPFMTLLKTKEIDQEVVRSKKIIEQKLRKPCKAFSYPFGDHNALTKECLISVGYHCGLTTRYGKNTQHTDTYALKRIVITNRYELPLFSLTLFVNFPEMHHELIKLYSTLKKLFYRKPLSQ